MAYLYFCVILVVIRPHVKPLSTELVSMRAWGLADTVCNVLALTAVLVIGGGLAIRNAGRVLAVDEMGFWASVSDNPGVDMAGE